MSDYPWENDPLIEKGLRPYPLPQKPMSDHDWMQTPTVAMDAIDRVLTLADQMDKAPDAHTRAMDAIDRVLTLADQMDKAPDAHTRALAASIRNAVTGGSDD